MNNYAIQNIRKMKSYSPPLEKRRSFNGRLLDFNERTIPPSKKILTALDDFIKSGQIQLYPEYANLCEYISKYTGVDKDQIMLTNGSDQAIDIVFRTFSRMGDKAVIPTPSFSMFYQYANIAGNRVISPVYKKDLSFPLREVLNCTMKNVKIVVICNPNNPTGTTIDSEAIKRILNKALNVGAIVLVDEAYYEFSKITSAGLLKNYPNLIITRTFSKAFGLASLRIGYIISSKENINEMIKIRGPYDVSMPAVVAAKAALIDTKTMGKYVDEVMNKSKPMVENFLKNKGITYFPSEANFILFKPTNLDKFLNLMQKKGFSVRPQKGRNIAGTIRLTIGTYKQMKEFINSFKYV